MHLVHGKKAHLFVGKCKRRDSVHVVLGLGFNLLLLSDHKAVEPDVWDQVDIEHEHEGALDVRQPDVSNEVRRIQRGVGGVHHLIRQDTSVSETERRILNPGI